jgi:hypothetical protein
MGTPNPRGPRRGEGGAPGMLFSPRSENPDLGHPPRSKVFHVEHIDLFELMGIFTT